MINARGEMSRFAMINFHLSMISSNPPPLCTFFETPPLYTLYTQ